MFTQAKRTSHVVAWSKFTSSANGSSAGHAYSRNRRARIQSNKVERLAVPKGKAKCNSARQKQDRSQAFHSSPTIMSAMISRRLKFMNMWHSIARPPATLSARGKLTREGRFDIATSRHEPENAFRPTGQIFDNDTLQWGSFGVWSLRSSVLGLLLRLPGPRSMVCSREVGQAWRALFGRL